MRAPRSGRIVIVGAGAAGTMAAIFAAEAAATRPPRPEVLLLERTQDGGRKILISGGGRCNILPSSVDLARFVTASSAHSLRNILKSWPLPEQISFFNERLGLDLTLEEESGKLFPGPTGRVTCGTACSHSRASLVPGRGSGWRWRILFRPRRRATTGTWYWPAASGSRRPRWCWPRADSRSPIPAVMEPDLVSPRRSGMRCTRPIRPSRH